MARHIRNARLESRAARAKLKSSGKPYFCSLADKLHLGYRKGKSGGKWVLRRYVGEGAYVVETIAESDDLADSDGVRVLTFHQAQEKARDKAKALAEEARIASIGPAITVRRAIEEYVDVRERREEEHHGGKARKRDARSRLGKHVLGYEALAAKHLAALTVDDLASWRESLPPAMAASSARRTTADFRAALYAAAKRYRAQLPPSLRDTIRDGLAFTHPAPAVAREAQVLPDSDVRALLSAAWEIDAEGGWNGDLALLVIVLAASGARFSQVIRMTVADVQTAQKRLMVPVSRKGQGVKQVSHTGVRVGDDVLAALTRATAGRRAHEVLLLRPHWRSLGFGRYEKTERRPWQVAHELTRVWPAIIARAGLATGTVPYSLRHSSIVRGLRAGLPVRLVAALHDTSTPMIEAHYSAFVTDALDELAARAVVPLTTAPATITPIRLAE